MKERVSENVSIPKQGHFVPKRLFVNHSHGERGNGGLLLAAPFMPFAIQQWALPALWATAGFLVWKPTESYQSSL